MTQETKYFNLTNLISIEDLDFKLYTDRDVKKVDLVTKLPIGTILLFKATNMSFTLIDYDATHYMFALNQGGDNKRVTENYSDELIGYNFQAFKISITDFNLVFGFDKLTGITPPNSAAVLLNVGVSKFNDNDDFNYRLLPAPKFMPKIIDIAIIKLMESIMIGFKPNFNDQYIENVSSKTDFYKEEPTKYSLIVKDRGVLVLQRELTIPEGMTIFGYNLKVTGKFMTKAITRCQ